MSELDDVLTAALARQVEAADAVRNRDVTPRLARQSGSFDGLRTLRNTAQSTIVATGNRYHASIAPPVTDY